MGREIRKVPAGWEHPRDENGHYRPLFDRDYETAMRTWYDELQAWLAGKFEEVRLKHPDLAAKPSYASDTPFSAFKDWHGRPPDPDYHRPRWSDEQRTHYQLYEDVTEGTPLSPPFATKEELVEHLVRHGDGWGQSISRKAAEAFVFRDGWAPSLAIVDGRMVQGVEISGLDRKDPR
jgi:hypothetical protein